MSNNVFSIEFNYKMIGEVAGDAATTTNHFTEQLMPIVEIAGWLADNDIIKGFARYFTKSVAASSVVERTTDEDGFTYRDAAAVGGELGVGIAVGAAIAGFIGGPPGAVVGLLGGAL